MELVRGRGRFLVLAFVLVLASATNSLETIESRELASAEATSHLKFMRVFEQARARFEGAEHRSICSNAAVRAKLGASSSPHKITLTKLTCVKGNELSNDEIEVEISFDQSSKTLRQHVFKSKGDSWDFSGEEVSFTFSNSFSIVIYEVDRGRSASVDQDDIVGKWTVSPSDLSASMTHDFSDSGQYRLEATGTKGESNPRADAVPLLALKSLRDDGSQEYQLTYPNICAMAGDFFAGEVPRDSSISWDVQNDRYRTEPEMAAMFEQVFEWFWKESSARFGGNIKNLMKQFDLEDQAIGRHKAHPDVSVNFAYAEQDSPYGGTTLNHVTNSHNNNMAKIMLDPPQQPDITYYMTSIGQGLDTKKYSRGMRSRFWVSTNYNFDHFLDGKADVIYRIGHELAVGYAVKASEATGDQRMDLFKKALACDAFAAHFGTDTFSAGHQRCQRIKMFQARTSEGFGGGCAKPTDDEYIAAEGAGAAAAFWHDEDGDVGLIVKNKHGAQWRSYGDRQYNHRGHAEGRNQAEQFVQASIDELEQAFTGTCDTEGVSGPKTIAKCIDFIRKRPKNALGYIPSVAETDSLNHPPLYREVGRGRWEYRTSWYDVRPPVYTAEWDCDNIVFGAWNVKDRFTRRNEVNARVRQEELTLTETYFNTMDVDSDKKVTLAEFGRWVEEAAIPVWPGSMIKSQLAVSLFKLLGGSKPELSLSDLQTLLVTKAADGSDRVFHVMEFLVAAFLKFVAANPSLNFLLRGLGVNLPAPFADSTATAHAGLSKSSTRSLGSMVSDTLGRAKTFASDTLTRAKNFVTRRSPRFKQIGRSSSTLHSLAADTERDHSSAVPTSGGENVKHSGECYVMGIDMCFVRDAVANAVRSTLSLKNLSPRDISKQVESAKELNLLPKDAGVEEFSKLVVGEQNRNAFRLLGKKVARKSNEDVDIPDYENMYWYAMAVANDDDGKSKLKPLLGDSARRSREDVLALLNEARALSGHSTTKDRGHSATASYRSVIKQIGNEAPLRIRAFDCDVRIGPRSLTPCVDFGLKPGEAMAKNESPSKPSGNGGASRPKLS